MSKNISLLGATYNDVPAIMLPVVGGGTAQFDDTTDANATASDIAEGKTAYVNGEKIVGTASGGGGDFFSTTNPQGALTTNISSIGDYVAYRRTGITSVSAPNATTVNTHAFQACTNLIDVVMPYVTRIYDYAFAECLNLTELTFSSLTTINHHAFTSCKGLRIFVAPSLTTTDNNSIWNDCYVLETADLGQLTALGSTALYSARPLTTLILRKTDSICTLTHVNALQNTKLTGYGGTYDGHIYVPSALKSTYENATNWSTLKANYNDIFATIEGSYYETHYADGTLIS